MAIGIAKITDKNFRITIPEEIRDIEGLKQGDYVQIEIIKVDLKESLSNSILTLTKRLDELSNKVSKS